MLDRRKIPEISALQGMNVRVPEKYVLKNGIPLQVIQAGSQEVVRMDILMGGGQWHQTQPLQALFTNRMLREGTQTMTSAQIAEKLDYYGAWLELSSSVSHGFITLYSLNKYFPKTLEIVSEVLKNPLFPDKELDVVREVNRRQFLVNQSKVEVIARKRLNQLLFGEHHPFGYYVQLEDYDRITSDVLRTFYHKYYHSGNCSIYVSGKVTEDIIRCVEDKLGTSAWGESQEVACLTRVEPTCLRQKRLFVEKEDALQSALKIGGFMVDQHHPDFLKLRILVTLFGGYFGSRLMANIREDKGYTYGIGAGMATCPGHGIMVISTEADNQYVESIITEVYHEMDRLKEELVPLEELEMVKNYMLGDWCRSYEGPFSLADAWIYVETSKLDKDFYTRSLEAIQTISREEIRTLAQKYFIKENFVEVIAGKKI